MAKTTNKDEKKQFKVKQQVSGVSMLKVETGDVVHVKFTSAFKVGKIKNNPATLASVVNLETGEIAKIIVSKVLFNILEENYPNESFVGKSFRIEKGEKVKGKAGGNAYNEFEVFELDE